MDRPITGFHQDEAGDWVAELDCLHGQHVRHSPPFVNRPWTESEAGRSAMLGKLLSCACCDRLEMPESLQLVKQTECFTETLMPKYLIQGHMLEKGYWGKVNVIEGTMSYTRLQPIKVKDTITPDHAGIIAPNQIFSLKPEGKVRFCLELYTQPN